MGEETTEGFNDILGDRKWIEACALNIGEEAVTV